MPFGPLISRDLVEHDCPIQPPENETVSGFWEQWRGAFCLYRKAKGALCCGCLDTLPVPAGFPSPAERRKFKKAPGGCGNVGKRGPERDSLLRVPSEGGQSPQSLRGQLGTEGTLLVSLACCSVKGSRTRSHSAHELESESPWNRKVGSLAPPRPCPFPLLLGQGI